MSAAPKLLLDTNVFRQLAHGDLSQYESRLVAIASNPTHHLFWLPDIAVQELLSRIPDVNDEQVFVRLVSAFNWADRLAGNRLAEGYDAAFRHGIFARPLDGNADGRIEINQVRRQIIKLERSSGVSQDLRAFAATSGNSSTSRQR